MWVEWWRMRWEEVRVEDVHKKQWMMLLPDGSTARDVTRWWCGYIWIFAWEEASLCCQCTCCLETYCCVVM